MRRIKWISRIAKLTEFLVSMVAFALPPVDRVVLSSRQRFDENLHELLSRAPSQSVWIETPDALELISKFGVSSAGLGQLGIVPRGALSRVWFMARSRTLASSHVAFFGHRASRGRRFVYLTHGVGPKRTIERGNIYTHFVSDVDLWNDAILANFRMSPRTEILHGLPRLNVLTGAQGHARVNELLKLGATQGYVVWAPTYRKTEMHGSFDAQNENYEGLSFNKRDLAAKFSEALAAFGIAFFIKPHPIEEDNYEAFGGRVMTDDQLGKIGIRPYEFLANAAGLITDYSSIGIDFLQLQRPIAFYLPDIRAVEMGRGLLEPSFGTLVKHLTISTTEDLAEFCKWVQSSSGKSAHLEELRNEIGLRQFDVADLEALANFLFSTTR